MRRQGPHLHNEMTVEVRKALKKISEMVGDMEPSSEVLVMGLAARGRRWFAAAACGRPHLEIELKL